MAPQGCCRMRFPTGEPIERPAPGAAVGGPSGASSGGKTWVGARRCSYCIVFSALLLRDGCLPSEPTSLSSCCGTGDWLLQLAHGEWELVWTSRWEAYQWQLARGKDLIATGTTLFRYGARCFLRRSFVCPRVACAAARPGPSQSDVEICRPPERCWGLASK